MGIEIRKVKILKGTAKADAEKQGLKSEDLVIVRTTVEKIEGDPLSYLLRECGIKKVKT